MLDRLGIERFDVLVIGAGVTGCGVALDAISRGLSVALVDAHDIASGTSSKSSKLVHGGLRYLQQGEVRLVYEALRERERLRRNAPHLVSVMPFMIPILTRDGVVSKSIARALGSAMWTYDLTGGARIGKLHRRLKGDAAFTHLPTMNRERLASAYLYYDAAADDARLCLALARTAAARGAVVATYAPVVELLHADGKGSGAIVEADGRRIEIAARVVVNAAGVWADRLHSLDTATESDTIRPAKGIHITVPWDKVRNDIAVVIPVPKDKRSLFVVPWGPRPDGTFEHTYVGTTDNDYTGPIDDPQCTADDIAYVLRALNASITTGITANDITGTWAGLRPLVKSAGDGRTADLSRRHRVDVSAHGMISVTGGKLTTYREMAQDTIDVAMPMLERKGRSRTARLRLHGATRPARSGAASLSTHLTSRFGTEATEIEALIASHQALGAPLVAGLSYVRAEVIFAARHEMAHTVDDVLSRRTRARLQDRVASLDAVDDVASLLAAELGWSAEHRHQQVLAYRDSVAHEIASERVASIPNEAKS
jgi:glycerol-3-phosphate dehydrogenase